MGLAVVRVSQNGIEEKNCQNLHYFFSMTNARKVNNLIKAMFSVFTCLTLLKFIFGTKNALLTSSIPEVAKSKLDKKSKFDFVPRERFHLNGHTKGFRPQTRKLEAPCNTQSRIHSGIGGLRLSCTKNIKI